MRIAMRGRRADDLSHQLLRAVRGQLARRERGYQTLRLALERFDVRRRFGAIRTQLVAVDGRLQSSVRPAGACGGRALARRRGAARKPQSARRPRPWLCGLLERGSHRDHSRCRRRRARRRVHVTLERGELRLRVTDHHTTDPARRTAYGFDHQGLRAAITELETIVKKLEEGDLPLETSLQLYERGVQLSRFCHAQLEQAERRIEILNERGGLTPARQSRRR
jgi:exodeoxyribonuclease VII small subunit